MKIGYHRRFLKHYQKRVIPSPNLDSRYKQRLNLWVKNRNDPLLKDHALTGDKEGFRAFCITGDIRVTYYPIDKGSVLFVDIGSHNQVY